MRVEVRLLLIIDPKYLPVPVHLYFLIPDPGIAEF